MIKHLGITVKSEIKSVKIMIKRILFLLVCTLLISSFIVEQRTDNSEATLGLHDSALFNNSALSFKVAAESIRGVHDTLFWFFGNEIEWYNGETGELKFTENVPEPTFIGAQSGILRLLVIVFLDDEALLNFNYVKFSYTSSTFATPFPNIAIHSCEKCGVQYTCYFISKCFPPQLLFPDREKNWKTIEPAWNIFVEQLKKEGKYWE